MESRNFCKMVSTTLAALAVTIIIGTGSALAVTYKTLHRFTGGVDGREPYATLTFDADGNLYGTTYFGGDSSCNGPDGCGTVFKLVHEPDGTWREQVLHAFTQGADGGFPRGGLIVDASGNLYGTTVSGGPCTVYYGGCGTVFKLTPNPDGTWTESVLHTFTGYDGIFPYAGLVFDAAGNLYGATNGTVYELTPNTDGSWTEQVLHSFLGSKYKDGYGDFFGSRLAIDAGGSLYGTNLTGGNRFDGGIVFKLSSSHDGAWTEQVLHRFGGPSAQSGGALPASDLVIDQTGNLYGTTTGCGGFCLGVVYKMTPNSDGTWTEHVIHWFTGGKDGSTPWAGLIFDSAGNLYGTTSQGGAYGYGVVFKLYRTAAGGWAEKVLWSFRNHPGAYPFAGLVLDRDGNLYGTTKGDGTSTFGTVFEITP